MEKVKIKDNILIIKEGDGYYDVRTSFEIDKLIAMVEEVGVKGGHIGWRFIYKDLGRDGEWFENEYEFGRKVRDIMEEIKGMIDEGRLNIEYRVELDVPTRCF